MEFRELNRLSELPFNDFVDWLKENLLSERGVTVIQASPENKPQLVEWLSGYRDQKFLSLCNVGSGRSKKLAESASQAGLKPAKANVGKRGRLKGRSFGDLRLREMEPDLEEGIGVLIIVASIGSKKVDHQVRTEKRLLAEFIGRHGRNPRLKGVDILLIDGNEADVRGMLTKSTLGPNN